MAMMLSNLAKEGNRVTVFVNGKAQIGRVSDRRDGRKVLIKTNSGDEIWTDERKLRTCSDVLW